MAIQSTFYTPDGSSLSYPQTKHIPSKQYVAVRLLLSNTDNWISLTANDYDLVYNTIVFKDIINPITYGGMEIRVADSQDELTDNLSQIGQVASIKDEIEIVAGIESNVVTVSENIGVIQNSIAASTDAVQAKDIAVQKAGEAAGSAATATQQATIATSKAAISTEQANIAISKANESTASASIVNAYGNLDWAGFIVSDGDLIVNYFDSSTSQASLVDGDFILTY